MLANLDAGDEAKASEEVAAAPPASSLARRLLVPMARGLGGSEALRLLLTNAGVYVGH